MTAQGKYSEIIRLLFGFKSQPFSVSALLLSPFPVIAAPAPFFIYGPFLPHILSPQAY